MTQQQQQQQQQRQRSQASSAMINCVIDIQGFRDSKGDFLPKEVAVLSLDARILGHWMIEAPHDFDSLPHDIKTTNNYCTLNLHGIEWYDGDVALDDVRSLLRRIGRRARTIFARGYDKIKYLESLLGRRIVNLEDYDSSIKYTELEQKFGGGPYCSIHGFEECSKKRFYCALNRAQLLKDWLRTILDEYYRELPESAQHGEDYDFHAALCWHAEASDTTNQYVAMTQQIDIENEYVEFDDVDDYNDNDEDDDDDDDDEANKDGENVYENTGESLVVAVAVAAAAVAADNVRTPEKKDCADNCDDRDDVNNVVNDVAGSDSNKEESVFIIENTEINDDNVNDDDDDGWTTTIPKIPNKNVKRSKANKQQQQQQQQQQQAIVDEKRTIEVTSSQPSPVNKKPLDKTTDGHSKPKRRLDFCCIVHKPSYKNSDNDDRKRDIPDSVKN